MEKRNSIYLLCFLAMSLFIAGVSFVSADPTKDAVVGFWNFFKDPSGNMDSIMIVAKILILVLVLVMVYSSLSMANLPTNPALRFVLSAVVSLLAVFLINNSEILTIMQTYKTLGVTISVFIPLVVLMFITYSVSVSMTAFGMLLQRLAWLVYAVYLLMKVGGLVILQVWGGVGASAPAFVDSFTKFVFKKTVAELAVESQSFDPAILVLLVVVSVIVIIWFVIFNEETVKWVAKVTSNADIQRYKDTANKSSEKQKIDAEQVKKT